MPNYAKFVEVACEAVLRASEVCRGVQGALDQVRAITKDDDSPVTVADFAAQAVVADVLSRELGEIHLVAEETSAFLRDPAHAAHLTAATLAASAGWPDVTSDALLRAIDVGAHVRDTTSIMTRLEDADDPEALAAREFHEGFWTLDPIDGTKGFLRGHQYAVCLAYIVGSEPVIGVLGCPNLPLDFEAPLDTRDALGCLYWAVKGGGVWRSLCSFPTPNHPHEKHPIEPDATSPGSRVIRPDYDAARAPLLVESFEPSHSRQDVAGSVMAALAPPNPGTPVRVDSQCKYALVARGQADVYLRLPSKRGYVEKIWDHASGALIAAEAGCIVTDARGKALDFSCGSSLEKNRGIVVSPPSLHPRLIETIAKMGMSEESATR